MQNTSSAPKFKSLPNFRDLASAGSDGWGLKSGLFFRSSNPDRISVRDLASLKAMNIRTVIDLRAPAEVKGNGGSLIGLQRINLPLDFQGKTREKLVPVLRQKNYEEEVEKISEWLYSEITDAAAPVFRKVAETVLDDGAPLLIHCQVGKDRTGIISALLHMVAGSSDDVIINDFMQSNSELLPSFRKMLIWQRIRRLGFFPHKAVLFAIQVRKRNIVSVLDTIDKKYGGVSGYLASAGFDLSRYDELRKKVTAV